MNKYDNLVLEHEYLIYKIINKYKYYYEKDDLYQVGVIGLIKAAKNYDYSFNNKFSTYAYYYILGEVVEYVNINRPIKLNKKILRLAKSIMEARIVLTQKLMKEPSNYELSLFLNISEKDIEHIEILKVQNESLDKIINFDNETRTLMDKLSYSPDEYNLDNIMIRDEIEKLSEPYKTIIYKRYFEDNTQAQIAQNLGIYQTDVSRKEKETLKKLKISLSKPL